MIQPLEGLQKAYLADITKDDLTGCTFGVPSYIEGIREIGFKPKSADAGYYHESKKVIAKSIFTEADMELDITDLSKEDYCKRLGHRLSLDGGILKSAGDIAPNTVLMFSCKKANGKLRFVTVYNCIFGLADDSYKQVEDKVDYQSKKFKVTAMPLKYNGVYTNVIDEEDGMTEVGFFAKVPVPEVKTK